MKLSNFRYLAFLFCGVSLSAFGDVFSVNVVGYVNQPIRLGENLIANQLHSSDDRLNHLFSSGIPNGSTVTKWDAATQGYLPLSYYSAEDGWSINYDLVAGQGALFTSTAIFTNTFVGDVHGVTASNTIVFEYPTVGAGTYLLSCSVPYGAASFDNIIGRAPYENESVRRLDALSQNYFTTTFLNGAWDNGAPALRVGEAAFFNLVPATTVVPEPGISALLAGGAFLFCARRLNRKRKE